MIRLPKTLSAALLCIAPALASAQATATLIADSVVVTADRQLLARGNVEAFYDGTRMTAQAITYDEAADRLTVTGPILIVAPDGSVIAAETAELDPQLRSGLLRGARLVLDQQLQLAAGRVDRIDGVSALTQVAATSCQVCGDDAPLWEIRAARVVHDEAAQQLYFDDATFRIGGVPVFWLPRMRLPDPTLERATGFLVPQIRSSNQLGVGLRLPYFVRLGNRRDVTVTPWISTKTRTLELTYRQAARTGWTEVTTSTSSDEIRDGLRYMLQAEGAYLLPRRFQLDFDLEAVSDPAYLLDYDLSDQDRLNSSLRLYRLHDTGLFLTEVTYYESLRDGEDTGSLPPLVGRVDWERVVTGPLGGRLRLGADGDALWRVNDSLGDEARDVLRAGLGADWRRDWVVGPGLLLGARGRAGLDGYAVNDDPGFADTILRSREAAAVTLRWPLMRAGDTGVVHVIEPVVSLGWSATQGDAVPNEDSRLVEFDEANLHDLDRLPGEDLREDGGRASLGLGWTRIGPNGWASTLQVGRILRDRPQDALSGSSGLAGQTSDWLVAGQLDLAGGFALNGRATLDGKLDVSRTEARLAWGNQRIDLSGAYVWLEADPQENRDDVVSEWSVDADWQVTDRWSLAVDARYDIAASAPVRAGFGAGWRNECVTVDLSVSRRYTESEDVEPSTSFGLSVNLNGFSAGRPATPVARHCDS